MCYVNASIPLQRLYNCIRYFICMFQTEVVCEGVGGWESYLLFYCSAFLFDWYLRVRKVNDIWADPSLEVCTLLFEGLAFLFITL